MTTVICINGVASIYMLMSLLCEGATDAREIVVLMALDGNQNSDWSAFYEKQLFPILAEKQIRTVQVSRVSNLSSEGFIVHADTVSPQKYYGGDCFSLEDSLLNFGMIFPGPSYLHKFRGWLIRKWLLSTFGKQPIRICLGLHAHQLKRLDRNHDLAGLKTNPNWSISLPVLDVSPEKANKQFTNRFSSLPSSMPIIPNGFQTLDYLRNYYDQWPERASRALLSEHVGLALSPNQLGWRRLTKLSLRESLAGNWEVEAFFQDYLRSLPWRIYGVKRLRGKNAGRSVSKSICGTQDFCLQYLLRLRLEGGSGVCGSFNPPKQKAFWWQCQTF